MTKYQILKKKMVDCNMHDRCLLAAKIIRLSMLSHKFRKGNVKESTF